MDCPICFSPFDQNTHSPLVTKCGHTFCSTCCSYLDTQAPLKMRCPTCKIPTTSRFQDLSKNFIVIQNLTQTEKIVKKPALNSKCVMYCQLASSICEDCCVELCDPCTKRHASLGHVTKDIDRFLQDIEDWVQDANLFIETASIKVKFYENLIKVKHNSIKKEIAAKFDALFSYDIQTYKNNSLLGVDEAFKNIETEAIFDLNLGCGPEKLDIRTCIKEFQDLESKDDQREKTILTHIFMKKYKNGQLKSWVEKDYYDVLKNILDKIQYKFPYPFRFCLFELETNAALDLFKLDKMQDEYSSFSLTPISSSYYYLMKPMIDKSSFQLSYINILKVTELNANLYIWNSGQISFLKQYDYFYLVSGTSPYLLLASYQAIKHVYIDVQAKLDNSALFQQELCNTLKYLAPKLETIKLGFASNVGTSFVDTLSENFTTFRKLKSLRITFTTPPASEVSLKLMKTLMDHGQRMERIELYNISTDGEIQLTDFFKTLNSQQKLVEFDIRCITGKYTEPHFPKLLSKYLNLIDLKLDLDWCLTQSMLKDFTILIKKLPLLNALSFFFDFDSDLDLKEFFEAVIEAPKLQLFAFFLGLKKYNKTLNEDLFRRLLKKKLKYLKLNLPIDPSGEKYITQELVQSVKDSFVDCLDFYLEIREEDTLTECFEDFVALFTQPIKNNLMKSWELKMKSKAAKVESIATAFAKKLPLSARIHFDLRFENTEQSVNTQELIKKLQGINLKGKYTSKQENGIVTLTLEI